MSTRRNPRFWARAAAVLLLAGSLPTAGADKAVTVGADGTTPLHWAAHRGDLREVEALIRAGADVNASNRFGSTPLYEAALIGNTAVIRRLLKARADPDAANQGGMTVLMIVARTSNVEAAEALIKAGADMSAADKAKAKAKAEALLAEARKNPAGFAELAKKNSEDPGSAANGGDLDFFGKGAMVKPFEDAVYALKKGEISNVIQSDFGYHVIMLTDLRGGQVRPFETVKAEIESELRKQLAQKRYTEMAEDFGNTVYEQSDSLKPAADKFKLAIQKATVRRKAAPDATGPLASAKLLEAVFDADSLKNKRNTSAIEAGGNQLVSARVVAYNAARVPALAEVKAAVAAAWVQDQSALAAKKAGEARLAELQKGGDAKGLGEPVTVSRAKPGVLPQKALDQVLRADASKLPAYAGVDVGDGSYLVVKIEKVLPRDPALIDPKRAADQYARAWSAAEMAGYYNVLKSEYKATIKPSALAATAASAPTN